MSNKEVKKKVPKSMTFVAASKSSHIARRCSHNVTVRRVAEMPEGSRHATSLKDRLVSVMLNSEASNMLSLATDGSDQHSWATKQPSALPGSRLTRFGRLLPVWLILDGLQCAEYRKRTVIE